MKHFKIALFSIFIFSATIAMPSQETKYVYFSESTQSKYVKPTLTLTTVTASQNDALLFNTKEGNVFSISQSKVEEMLQKMNTNTKKTVVYASYKMSENALASAHRSVTIAFRNSHRSLLKEFAKPENDSQKLQNLIATCNLQKSSSSSSGSVAGVPDCVQQQPLTGSFDILGLSDNSPSRRINMSPLFCCIKDEFLQFNYSGLSIRINSDMANQIAIKGQQSVNLYIAQSATSAEESVFSFTVALQLETAYQKLLTEFAKGKDKDQNKMESLLKEYNVLYKDFLKEGSSKESLVDLLCFALEKNDSILHDASAHYNLNGFTTCVTGTLIANPQGSQLFQFYGNDNKKYLVPLAHKVEVGKKFILVANGKTIACIQPLAEDIKESSSVLAGTDNSMPTKNLDQKSKTKMGMFFRVFGVGFIGLLALLYYTNNLPFFQVV